MTRVLLCVVACIGATACSGKVLDSSGGAGGTSPGAGGAETGAQSGNGGSFDSDGASTGSGGVRSSGGVYGAGGASTATGGMSAGTGGTGCDDLSNKASAAFDRSAADLSCTTDDDCVYGPVPGCVPACFLPIVSKAGVKQLQAGVDAAAPICAEFMRDGCRPLALPCIGLAGGPACVNGKCENFVPTRWKSLSFTESTQGLLDCTMATLPCSFTRVTPDGIITFSARVGAKSIMDAAHLKAFTAIVESITFRHDMQLGFDCGGRSSPDGVMMVRESPDGTQISQDVSGCIETGPPMNDPLTLWNIVNVTVNGPDGGVRDGG